MSENIALNKFVGGNAKLAVENSANSFSVVTNGVIDDISIFEMIKDNYLQVHLNDESKQSLEPSRIKKIVIYNKREHESSSHNLLVSTSLSSEIEEPIDSVDMSDFEVNRESLASGIEKMIVTTKSGEHILANYINILVADCSEHYLIYEIEAYE